MYINEWVQLNEHQSKGDRKKRNCLDRIETSKVNEAEACNSINNVYNLVSSI